jgi:hypothetical protein
MERSPQRFGWALPFLAFLLLCFGMGALTGLRLILFPPLVVIAFEMFARRRLSVGGASCHASCRLHSDGRRGLMRACRIRPGSSLGCRGDPNRNRRASCAAPSCSTGACCGPLAQIMERPGWSFVLSVAIGTLTLTATFLFARTVARRTRNTVSSR